MEFPKQIKDTVYRLLQEPTLDHFREFLQDQTGEHNAIDFKQEWIEKDKLAKLMLALANYGGGIVVFGVHENGDKTFSCDGLKELQAKEQIGAWIKPYLSSSLKYDVYDFSYQTSEYEALKGKQFQMLFVEDTPQFLPFISRKEGSNIKPATIYIRRGTSDEQVTEEELGNIGGSNIVMEYTEVLDKQITRKQHYVPKAYLKNFSVSNQKSEQVYVVFANDENAKMVSIDNICCRSYLYDQIAIDPDSKTHIFAAPNEIENSFIELEGEYATIISKIKDLLISNRIDLLSYIDFSIDAEKEDDEQVYQLLHTDKETALKQYEDMMSSKEIKYWG